LLVFYVGVRTAFTSPELKGRVTKSANAPFR